MTGHFTQGELPTEVSCWPKELGEPCRNPTMTQSADPGKSMVEEGLSPVLRSLPKLAKTTTQLPMIHYAASRNMLLKGANQFTLGTNPPHRERTPHILIMPTHCFRGAYCKVGSTVPGETASKPQRYTVHIHNEPCMTNIFAVDTEPSTLVA